MVSTYSDEGSSEYGWQELWGVKFKWTPEHLTSKQLEPLMYTYDTVATNAIERLDEISPPPSKAEPLDERDDTPVAKKKIRRDLYELLQQYGTTDERIGKLWSEVNTVPEWVDWEQLERGQKVFYRYGGPAITALTFSSLLGSMGSGRTVETLDRTRGFSIEVVRRRLLETTQHTLNVTRDLESIKPGGDGFVDSVRVRLLHAAVRRRIMKMTEAKPEYYDVKKFGIPINDLDCIGTINAFSATLIWMGLQRQGIWLQEQEVIDYLALWRYVAYLIGTPHDWMVTPESARRMMESLLVSEVKPTKASANLANNIITGLEGQPPTYASKEFMCAQTYWLNGSELAQALDIDRPSTYYFALMFGQCILFTTFGYINRSISYLDERNIKLVRKALYKILLYDKSKGALGYMTKFNLKYTPSFDKMSTERGVARTQAGAQRIPAGVERTALVSLTFATLVAIASVWCCAKALGWLVTR